MLLEEGFRLTSVDLSDKMLKYALKTRWKRRKEPAFDAWGTWLTHLLLVYAILDLPFYFLSQVTLTESQDYYNLDNKTVIKKRTCLFYCVSLI
jgi:hypothetical protein